MPLPTGDARQDRDGDPETVQGEERTGRPDPFDAWLAETSVSYTLGG